MCHHVIVSTFSPGAAATSTPGALTFPAAPVTLPGAAAGPDPSTAATGNTAAAGGGAGTAGTTGGAAAGAGAGAGVLVSGAVLKMVVPGFVIPSWAATFDALKLGSCS